MQKRIFLNFVGLILICLILLATSFGLIFFNAAQDHEMASIRDQAQIVAQLLNLIEGNYPERLHGRIHGGDTRITLIAADGWVLADSYPGADLTINRSDRLEFIQAISQGSGEAIRPSDTLAADTFYYAMLLQDGSVLRLSRTLYSLGEVFTSTLPSLIAMAVLIMVVAYFIAQRLTKKIIEPIIQSSQADMPYEELWPYIRKINKQEREIARQMTNLRNRAETIEAIIANMREGLILVDEKGFVLTVNKSILDIFGISGQQEVIQKNVQQICRAPEFMQAVKACLEGTHLEISLARNDKIYNIYLSPVESKDQNNRGAIIFFLDTTEKFNAESQRREFSANVSHELKTPLTTISALSEMMANGMAKPEDMPEFSDKISKHSKRLINIIDDIIRLSEFDENKVGEDFTTFDIYELSKSVVGNLQEKAAEKSVTLELTGESPLTLKANEHLIDELIYNLIDNGIKYNKEGGKVSVNLGKENDYCKITVADTGIGISKEHQSRIFERFYRVDNSRSKKTGGSGLGLSIVKHIIEHHNARVNVESSEGEGTSFEVYLPLYQTSVHSQQ